MLYSLCRVPTFAEGTVHETPLFDCCTGASDTRPQAFEVCPLFSGQVLTRHIRGVVDAVVQPRWFADFHWSLHLALAETGLEPQTETLDSYYKRYGQMLFPLIFYFNIFPLCPVNIYIAA